MSAGLLLTLMIALTVLGTGAAAVVYALASGSLQDWGRRLFSAQQLPFLLVGLAVGVTTFFIFYAGKVAGDEALELDVENFERDCDDQLGLVQHANATAIADALGQTNRVTHADLCRLAEYYSLDEVNIVATNGEILVSTDAAVKPGDRFDWSRPEHLPYRDLLTGRRSFVKQRFRQSVSSPDLYMKYFAMPLPKGGFLQLGYSWQVFEQEFSRFFFPMFEGRRVGETGFYLVVDASGRIVLPAAGHPETEGMTAAEAGLTEELLAEHPGRIFRTRILGTWCRCLQYETIGGYRLYAVLPLWETQSSALGLAAVVAFVILGMFVVFRLVMARFHRAQAKIDALRAEEEAHRAADLRLARTIQQDELRTDERTGDGYALDAQMDAAREVGGDFYDYYQLADGRLVVTIADVSGKGVPAAFFMLKAKAMLRAWVYPTPSLAEAVAGANAALCERNAAEMFVTAWVGVFDPKTRALEYVSAGHNAPLVRRADGTVAWVANTRAAALGVFETARYRAARFELGPGDTLFLYTDGVNEATDEVGALFGNARLERALAASGTDVIAAVSRAVSDFVADAEQADDITMLTLTVTERKAT